MHNDVTVFVEDGDWFVQFQARCHNLGADNRCLVYETRPEICREYEPGSCDYAGGPYTYDHHFTHAKQIEEFYFKRTGKKLGKPTPPRRRPAPRKKKSA